MFFILRSLFWLSFVYAHLPTGGTAAFDAGSLLDMARAHIGGAVHRQAPSLVATLASGGEDWCKAHGEACADAVLAAMMTKADEASATSGGAPSKAAGVSKATGASSRTGTHVLDTLTAGDRAPRWAIPPRG